MDDLSLCDHCGAETPQDELYDCKDGTMACPECFPDEE